MSHLTLASQLDDVAEFLPREPADVPGSATTRIVDNPDQLLGKVLRFDLIDLDSAEYLALAGEW